MKLQFRDRYVTELAIGGVDRTDYPDFCDAFFESAYWADTQEPLTDDELDALAQEHYATLHELACEQAWGE